MRPEASTTLGLFLVEILLYAVLVTLYFLLVLRYLSDWLQWLHLHHTVYYAAIAVVLIIGQAVLLQTLTTWLLRTLRRRSE